MKRTYTRREGKQGSWFQKKNEDQKRTQCACKKKNQGKQAVSIKNAKKNIAKP